MLMIQVFNSNPLTEHLQVPVFSEQLAVHNNVLWQIICTHFHAGNHQHFKGILLIKG